LDKKTLILFTSYFPFEPFEEYLENEINYLTSAFDKIYIFSQSSQKGTFYKLPDHVSYYNNSYHVNFFSKIYAIFLIRCKILFEEKKFINQKLKISFSLTRKKILLIDYLKAKNFSNPVSKIIKHEISEHHSVFLYSYWNDYKAIAAALLKKDFPQIKAVSRAHGWDIYLERNTENYLPLKKFMADYFDSIYFVSENGKQYFQNRFQLNGNLKLARLGVENSYPFKVRKKSIELRLVSCSKLIPLKRIELLIEALYSLQGSIKINWIHFGDGILFNSVKDYAKEKLSDESNIQFSMPGYIDHQAILDHYKNGNTDILINVSSTEGLPLTMIEAMSYGIPVIGTDVGGISEIIEDKVNGLLIHADSSPREIAEAIEIFYKMSDEEYSKYCLNAYQTWKTKFNAEKNYPEFIENIFSV